MKKIVLTGGGTAGHVTPNLALLPHLRGAGWEVSYIGTRDGMERGLIEPAGVPYYAVQAGKLRRYADLKNLSDPFRVVQGAFQAVRLLRTLKPDVVFAKGGFVSVPVVYGAALCRIPVVLHESDLTPGLANKLCAPFARAVCTTFPETAKAVRRGVCTGTPLRDELFQGQRARGLAAFGFSGKKPVLLVTGGSSGAQAINAALRGSLPALLPDMDVLHLCGKGNLDASLNGVSGYHQAEYLREEMRDAFACADAVVSRAGSNTLCELLALKKPSLLIPYPRGASRGDQEENAASFASRGLADVLEQKDLSPSSLQEAVRALFRHREALRARMEASPAANGTQAVLGILAQCAKGAR